MTLRPGARGALAPVVASLVTAGVLVGALWVQRQRHAWPFVGVPEDAAPVASPDGAAGDMAGMDMRDETAGDPSSRVDIDVTAEMRQTLGVQIQPVRRERLTETIQAVATVAPDESRISRVHTRVAGWVEQLDVNTTGETVRAGQPSAPVLSGATVVPDGIPGRAADRGGVRHHQRRRREWAHPPERPGHDA